LGRHGITSPGKLAAEIGEAMLNGLGREGFLGTPATFKQELVKILYFFTRSWRKYGKIKLAGCCHDAALLAKETVAQMNMHDKFLRQLRKDVTM
jgi:hypothetical protein